MCSEQTNVHNNNNSNSSITMTTTTYSHYQVPFSKWPPTTVGQTTMVDQFRNPQTGDMKLFVDFSDVERCVHIRPLCMHAHHHNER